VLLCRCAWLRYAHNGTEFAFLACSYDSDGHAVSGMGQHIECKV